MFTALRPRTATFRSHALAAARPALSARSFHKTIPSQKEAGVNPQDKDKINAEPTEYSKTGSDAQAAHDDAAFSRDKTRPEDHTSAGDREPSDSLNASPANTNLGKPPAGKQDSSKSSPSEDSSSEGSRQRTSGGGSPAKNGSSPVQGQGSEPPKGSDRVQQ